MERFQLSIVALHQIAVREVTRPGRKIILWISPGWPLLAGPSVELNSTERQQAFTDIVTLSTLLRQAGITLYSIDPLGTEDFANRSFHWQAFVKRVSKPDQAEWGDIALPVLAVQTGGLALTTSNDLAGGLGRCLADTQAYYELSFAPSADQKKNEYHRIEVRVAKAGVSARTRHSYYSKIMQGGSP
jgi:VWFA-related protein